MIITFLSLLFQGFDSFVGQVVRVQRSGGVGLDPVRDLVDLVYRFCSSGHGEYNEMQMIIPALWFKYFLIFLTVFLLILVKIPLFY
jgi:hypothetical protein